ncbi:MAG: 3-phosphoserine/phosphohydroxythreonine transaminase [Planctomycetota bacterium]
MNNGFIVPGSIATPPPITPRGRVLRWVRGQVESGGLQPGDDLPGERRVAAAVGVSRETVRAAWTQLERMGLIEFGRQGKTRRIAEAPRTPPLAGGLRTPAPAIATGADPTGLTPNQTTENGPIPDQSSRKGRRKRRRKGKRKGQSDPQREASVVSCSSPQEKASATPMTPESPEDPETLDILERLEFPFLPAPRKLRKARKPRKPPIPPPSPLPRLAAMNSSTPAAPSHRIYNFSAGPCTLPLEVLEQAQAELTNFRGTGMGVMEMSHRSKPVVEVHEAALASLREVMQLPDNYQVLFLTGGATFQFGMVPLNLAAPAPGSQTGQRVDYTHSGAWAKKAIADAKAVGADVNLVFDGTDSSYTTLPDPATVQSTEDSAYLHLTTNETIGGLQWKAMPDCNAPIVADMSSDFLSKPIDVSPFGLIYAGAQKNIGPAGVCVVIIRDDVLKKCNGKQVNYLNYANHHKGGSMLNTPPVFQIYMVGLVMEWLKAKGGVAWAEEMAEKRSGLLYDTIATSGGGGFYSCPVDERFRSTMNVVFRLPTEELEAKFITDAAAQGLDGLKGHRSVGGCRASIYNAMPLEGAQALADFMREFARTHG